MAARGSPATAISRSVASAGPPLVARPTTKVETATAGVGDSADRAGAVVGEGVGRARLASGRAVGDEQDDLGAPGFPSRQVRRRERHGRPGGSVGADREHATVRPARQRLLDNVARRAEEGFDAGGFADVVRSPHEREPPVHHRVGRAHDRVDGGDRRGPLGAGCRSRSRTDRRSGRSSTSTCRARRGCREEHSLRQSRFRSPLCRRRRFPSG